MIYSKSSICLVASAASVGISKYLLEKRALCNTGSTVESSKFLQYDSAKLIKTIHGTPTYVYSESCLFDQAHKALEFPNAFGLTVRFAMKACPNASILRLFANKGVCFDASSGHEVSRAIRAGINPSTISLSSQELPDDFEALINHGIEFNACSLQQLTEFGKLFPGRSCGVRINPGQGSGGTGKTNVGGPDASFGIWFEHVDEIKTIASTYNLNINRIHTHIGSGSDPDVWEKISILSLDIVRSFPSVTVLNLGGGFKVGRVYTEKSTDLQIVGASVKKAFVDFSKSSGRRLRLEIEPGTFLVANCGALLSTIQDIVTTRKSCTSVQLNDNAGHTFLKLDCGMTEILRPSLYGAQHPVVLLRDKSILFNKTADFIVVGHCCESGDLISCAPGQSEVLQPRTLPASAAVGDLVSIEGAGAYCASMSAKNYNSFPEAPEVLISEDGSIHLIKRRQTMDQMLQNELNYTKL